MENSEWYEKLLHIFREIGKHEDFEIYLFIGLLLFTLWFIRSTVKYYYGQKRKLRHMHRFAREGDVDAQRHLAARYRKGDILPKSCERAAYWYHKVALTGDEEAKGYLQKFLESHRKKC